MSTEIECTGSPVTGDNPVIGEFLRYVVVGGVAAVADLTVLYAAAVWMHVHYLLAGVLGFVVGLAVNYVLSVTWAFRSRNLDSRSMEFALFAGIGVIGLGVNEVVLYVMTGLLALHIIVSKMTAIFTVFMWNFGGRKFLLFRSTSKRSSGS